MSRTKTLTFALLDPPFESARTTTLFRLLDSALEARANVDVFAYEGAVALSFAQQQAHGNSVHDRNVEEEAHPLSREWIVALQRKAEDCGVQFRWINCGLCADERGINNTVAGCGRGSPADLWKFASAADNTLIVGTRD
jgi:tRNA 2-thiouridine synthesizing protein D